MDLTGISLSIWSLRVDTTGGIVLSTGFAGGAFAFEMAGSDAVDMTGGIVLSMGTAGGAFAFAFEVEGSDASMILGIVDRELGNGL